MSEVTEKVKELEFRLTGLECRVEEILNGKLVHMAGRITRMEDKIIDLAHRQTKLALRQELG
uniref:Uncharacterized protein n=1 Tax=viral metagenome TaxID=1070528 RepID=A0A6H2A630_9ZZZZ